VLTSAVVHCTLSTYLCRLHWCIWLVAWYTGW